LDEDDEEAMKLFDDEIDEIMNEELETYESMKKKAR
jgi:hypothetical protein